MTATFYRHSFPPSLPYIYQAGIDPGTWCGCGDVISNSSRADIAAAATAVCVWRKRGSRLHGGGNTRSDWPSRRQQMDHDRSTWWPASCTVVGQDLVWHWEAILTAGHDMRWRADRYSLPIILIKKTLKYWYKQWDNTGKNTSRPVSWQCCFRSL